MKNASVNARRESVLEHIEKVRKMFIDTVSFLERNDMKRGSYFKFYEGNNWLIQCDKNGNGFIGEPMNNEGWFCYEFDEYGEFCSSEPMFYKDLSWCINKVRGVI